MKNLKKFFKLIRDTWLIIGITLLLLLLLNAGATLTLSIKRHFTVHREVSRDRKIKADAYDDSSWVKAYYSEHDRSSEARWEPYVYWRRKTFHGNYINIDTNGIRLTVNASPSLEGTNAALKIFMFGGSTMWGTGVRDEFTIPSILAKELKNKGINCQVVNFGESGYVNTQELIELLIQLQKQNIPHLAIFYDGVNDVFSAYQMGLAGLPQNEFNRVNEFNLTDSGRLKRAARQRFVNELAIVRLLKSFEPEPAANSANNRVQLAPQVVQTYGNNLKLAQALSVTYGFKSMFYWQPTVFQKKNLSRFETSERDRESNVKELLEKTYELIHAQTANFQKDHAFYDISLIFSDVQEPLYTDWCHVSEKGNAIVAQRIAADVESLIGVNGRLPGQPALPKQLEPR